MSWTRLDDNWTRKIRAMRMEFQTRWHYLEMIQFVSGSDTFESPIRPVDARTCSDVDDPIACLAELEALGLLSRDSNGDYLIVRIIEHIPSPEVRDRTAAERDKKRRQRAHAKGNHDLCSPSNCPSRIVPGTVPGTTKGQRSVGQQCPANGPGTVGTGQDGPGREELPPTLPSVPRQPGPPSAPCGVDLVTGEVDGCADCGEALTWCRC